MDETPQGIQYEYYLTGPDGARFTLYPERGKHTKQDLKASKRYLRNEHDVLSFKVEWIHG